MREGLASGLGLILAEYKEERKKKEGRKKEERKKGRKKQAKKNINNTCWQLMWREQGGDTEAIESVSRHD